MPTAPTVTRDPALEAHVFWFEHRREILIGIGLIVLALIGYAGFWFYNERRNEAAATALAQAHDAGGYQQVISRYDNTNAGATAYLLLADAQKKGGKYADANATLQKFIDKQPKHQLIPTARMAIAANLQALGRIDEAQAMYQRVAADFPKSFEAPAALMSQVAILKIKKQQDAARRTCETVLTQYRDSIWASEAMQQLRGLKPAESPSPAPGVPGAPSTLGGQKPGSAPPPMLARPPGGAPPPAPSTAAPAGAKPSAPNAQPSAGKP